METLSEAVRLGGKKLADYDGERNRFYEASGFVAESRADFDPKQAPKGWDYEKQGKPDILFWRYAGEEAAQAAKPTDVESLWKSNYEVAEEWRDTEIRKAEEENANKTVEEEKQPANEHMVDKKPKSDIIKEEKGGQNGNGRDKNGTQRDTNMGTGFRIESFIEQPELLEQIEPVKLYYDLIDNGYEVKPLGKGNFAGIPFEQGGGYRVNWGGDKILQYHPASRSHHGGAYFKISSGKTGTIRIYK